ncbi:MAG: cytochrome c3 family protein [Alphaproteobacteria bacterium]|nr:cytochrome c3 family protein [Alphaproteobacteria bacterium]
MWLRIATLVATLAGVLAILPMAQGQALHDVHKEAGVACTACHKEEPAAVAPPNAVCVACHGAMLGQDAPAVFPDPHRSPHLGPDEIPACNDCHKIHRESEVTCVMCHRGFEFQIK